MPWAGGFFDGGLLPCLFLGSVLGSGFGMFGGARAGDAFDGGGDFAEFGGGDLLVPRPRANRLGGRTA
jgi:hypothetical protein